MFYDEIILRYGLEYNLIKELFGKRQPREIIDVDYVDVSDDAEASLLSEPRLLECNNDTTTPNQELKQ